MNKKKSHLSCVHNSPCRSQIAEVVQVDKIIIYLPPSILEIKKVLPHSCSPDGINHQCRICFPALLLLIPVHLPVFNRAALRFVCLEANLFHLVSILKFINQVYPVRHQLRLSVFSKCRIVRDSQMHL